jgi:hypothetical protein
MKSRNMVVGSALAACICMVAAGTTAAAATLWTSNVGADSGSCGTSAAPCRSISQAIANASDGDTIWVGPGHYGDVNGDGNFTGPGDEQPDPNGAAGYSPGPYGCIVCITKALHIYSTDGAALTFIESNAATGPGSTVMILHDGVDFGAVDHGFTIAGGNSYGVSILPFFSGSAYSVSQDMTIKGNVDIGDGVGFYMGGFDYQTFCPTPYCQFIARILVASNRAINNTTGFEVIPAFWFDQAGGWVVRDNEALGAGTGFYVLTGYRGYITENVAPNVQLVNNIAAHGGTGFYAVAPGPVSYNTALDNSQSGFTVTPGGAPFNFNAAIGNGGPGVIINLSSSGLPFDGSVVNPFSTFSGNDFLGNDRKRSALFLNFPAQYVPGPSAHCGILNLGRLADVSAPPATQFQAANNYWGSSKGPSSTGPGDNAGGACDQNNSATITKPFSQTKFASTVTPTVLEN